MDGKVVVVVVVLYMSEGTIISKRISDDDHQFSSVPSSF